MALTAVQCTRPSPPRGTLQISNIARPLSSFHTTPFADSVRVRFPACLDLKGPSMTHRIKWQLLERSYINWAGPSIEAVWGDPSGIRRRPFSASSVPSERGPFRS